MSKKVVMIMADGFEEIEAIATADTLMRLGLDVTLTGMSSNKVTGAHGIAIETATILADESPADYDAAILPGGMPGSVNLRDNARVIDFVKTVYANGKVTAAICAAPIALAKAGILDGKKATCYPSFEAQFAASTTYTGNRVEIDGRVVTAKGAGVSFDFAAAVGSVLGITQAKIDQTFAAMFKE
jgi:DJ-1 family protein